MFFEVRVLVFRNHFFLLGVRMQGARGPARCYKRLPSSSCETLKCGSFQARKRATEVSFLSVLSYLIGWKVRGGMTLSDIIN